MTEGHRAEAACLQAELAEFAAELAAAIDEIWKRVPETEGDAEPEAQPHQDSWAARMEAHEKRKHTNPVDTVARPDVAKQQWTLRLPEGSSRS